MTSIGFRGESPEQASAAKGALRFAPSLVSSVRVVITALLLASLLEGGWGFPLFVLACVTDLVDGALARRLNAVTETGGVLDACADFLLVLSTSVYLAWSGLVGMWFPVLIVAAFGKFVVGRAAHLPDPLGKHIGTVLFVALLTVLYFPSAFVAAWATSLASFYVLASMALSFVVLPMLSRRGSG